MIFITTGTHEQPFNRWLKVMDEFIAERQIEEEVFAQLGYSTYKPKLFDYQSLIPLAEMELKAQEARIIITHGGPGSIWLAFKYNKIPIVIPRNPYFDEHVDDHQMEFAKHLRNANRVIVVNETEDLSIAIENYDLMARRCILPKSQASRNICKFTCLLDIHM